MAVADFIKSGFSFDYLFLPKGASDTAKEVSAAQERLVQERAIAGKIDSEKQAQLLSEIAGTTNYDVLFSDPANRPTTAFIDEVKSQISKLPANIRNVVSSVTAFPFKLIPANLWFIIIIAVLVYLGWKLNVLGRFAYQSK